MVPGSRIHRHRGQRNPARAEQGEDDDPGRAGGRSAVSRWQTNDHR